MDSLMQVLLSFIKRITGAVAETAGTWTDPEFIRGELKQKISGIYQRMTDVKPRDREDYYRVFSWMIGKRLAFLLAILAGAVSLWILLAFHPFSAAGAGAGGIRTYSYRSVPLRFQKGPVRIKAKDGHIAYVGDVKDGAASGQGRLYSASGSLIYDGAFENSMFQGTGWLYYESGPVRYSGSFLENRYDGAGTEYREDGSKVYEGEYRNGLKSGQGTLCNISGSPVFTGQFSMDQLQYSQLAGKTVKEISSMYTGKARLYRMDTETCTVMEEIEAMYVTGTGPDTLEGEWKAGKVFVLDSGFWLGGGRYDSLVKLEAVLGPPVYRGFSDMEFSEAVGIEEVRRLRDTKFPDPGLQAQLQFEDAWLVEDFGETYDFYLTVFEKNGLLYSFYSPGRTDGFEMYSIEMADQ